MVREKCADGGHWPDRQGPSESSANFSHGHHGDATDADNPRCAGATDPADGGVSGAICGLRHPTAHAYGGAFIAGDEVETCRRNFRLHKSPSRTLETTRWLIPHEAAGTVGSAWLVLWPSGAAATGSTFRSFGETGGCGGVRAAQSVSYNPGRWAHAKIMGKGRMEPFERKRTPQPCFCDCFIRKGSPPWRLGKLSTFDLAEIRGQDAGSLPFAVDGLGRWRRSMRLWPRQRQRPLGSMRDADVAAASQLGTARR